MRFGFGHGHCAGRRARSFGPFGAAEDDRFGARMHGGPRGRGLGRFFAHGDLRLVILHFIAEKPRHGYELMKSIEDRVGGAYSPSPGVIYPTLTLLEELDYVTTRGAGEGGRKLYEITDQGRAYLEANRSTLEALLARMDEAGRVHGGGPPPQVLRGLENLKVALRLRLGRGPLTAEEADAVAKVLDEAARAVEQVR